MTKTQKWILSRYDNIRHSPIFGFGSIGGDITLHHAPSHFETRKHFQNFFFSLAGKRKYFVFCQSNVNSTWNYDFWYFNVNGKWHSYKKKGFLQNFFLSVFFYYYSYYNSNFYKRNQLRIVKENLASCEHQPMIQMEFYI